MKILKGLGVFLAVWSSGQAIGGQSKPVLRGTSWTVEGDQRQAAFGTSVATAGDVNGDGFSDVIVGAYRFDDGQTDEGKVFVYLGSAEGPRSTADWTAENDQAFAVFGGSVATA